MAFNMKRPIIKGTPIHKASIARAEEKSIVSQRKTQADPKLVAAAGALGRSYLLPNEIDFSIDQTIDGIGDARGGRKKKVKEETDEQKQKRINKRRKQKIDDRRLGKKEGNQKIYDNLTKRKNSRGLTEQEQKALDKASKELGIKRVKKEKTPTDNMFNDVDGDGNVVSRLFGRARAAAEARKKQKEKDYQAAQAEKEKLNAEQLKIKTAKNAEQAKIEAEKQAKIDAEKLKKDKQKAKVKELEGYQKEKDAADKEAQRLKDIQMNKKKGQVYELDSIKAEAIGGKQINQYTKEQRDRLEAEGVWSDEAEKMVLPEEIVDGEFVSKAEGTSLEVVATDQDGNNQTNNTVVEEKEAPKVSSGKQRLLDLKYKLAGSSVRANMEAGGYVPPESKSPMEMRDDRVYKFARKDGAVRKNMIKGGYKPQ